MPFTKLISTALNLALADSHGQKSKYASLVLPPGGRSMPCVHMLKNQSLSSNRKSGIKVERKELQVLRRLINKDLICLEPSSLHLCVSPLSYPPSLIQSTNRDRSFVSYKPSTRCSGQGVPLTLLSQASHHISRFEFGIGGRVREFPLNSQLTMCSSIC